jgi:putative DeoR family transcriptional regulator (stage III sporulation protein D)
MYKEIKGQRLREYIERRTLEMAKYTVNNNSTVRATAKYFGVSKSTAHQDLSVRIYALNPVLAAEVRKVLDKNKAERHIRGGMATKTKYETEQKMRKKSTDFHLARRG